MTQAASLHTSIALESSSFVVPLRDLTAEIEKSSRKMEKEHERLAKSADRLLSSVDPVYAAQSRFNKEMDKAKSLYSAGAISAEQFAMAESNLKARLEQATSALTTHNAVSAQSQQRMRNLGFQISDIGTQLAGGQNPFLILAQQGPQVVNALDGVEGKLGKVASFLSGPWGAALMAAGSMAGMFASKLWESHKAAEEAATKHEKSVKTLQEALDELDRSTGRTAKATAVQIEADLEAAQTKLEKAKATREEIKAELDLQRALIQGQKMRATGVGPGSSDAAALRLPSFYEEEQKILEKLAKQDEEITKIDVSLLGAKAAKALQDVTEKMDAAAAATAKYERAHAALRKQFETPGSGISEEEFARREEALRRTRDAEIAAANAAEKTGKANDKSARDWEKASNSRIQALLSERTAMEQYTKDLKFVEEAYLSGSINVTERTLATIRARQEMLNGLGLEKIAPKIADFDADKAVKDALPKFDPKDLFEISPIREFANELERSAERAQRLDQMATQMAAHMASSFEEAIFSGKGLRSVFNGLLEDMGKMVLRFTVLEPLARSFADALKGSGGVGSSIAPGEDNVFARMMKGIGSIFGGFFADGGNPPVGKVSVVGERGPELFVPRSAGTIIPNEALQGMGGGGGVVIHQTFAPTFAGNAATREEVYMMGRIAKEQAIAGVREAMSRRGSWRR